ncbi:hypothetical protein VB264_15230 [Arcicella aquatica]|uniref:VWFA domain-containing protein n=1 Tax=Arcicella aquatica TaxID=217141 RepID=A0ABU5QPY7_9BACT|nr:hypothetical protein [Arcicella aquatica]MEA5259148.1 hypothetical protein [Arcicella aquatica]
MRNLEYYLSGFNFYTRNFPSGIETIIWVFGSLVLSYFVGIVLNKQLVKRKDGDTESRILKEEFYVHRSHIYAGYSTMLLSIGIIGYYWSSGKYGYKHLESTHLLMLIACACYSIFWFLKLKEYYTASSLRKIVEQPTSEEEHNDFSIKAKKAFDKSKRWVLILFLGAVAFLYSFSRPLTLISIVIDDSGSMGNALAIGKDAITETMNRLSGRYTDIFITSFGIGNPTPEGPHTSFSELARIKRITNRNIDAKTQFCDDPNEASEFVASLIPDKGFGLNQAIWHNYIKTKEYLTSVDSSNYQDRIMLIITDGEEFSRAWYDTTFCSPQYDFNRIYGKNVYMIDLHQSPNSVDVNATGGFRTVMRECYGNEHIYNGFEQSDYIDALNYVLKPYELDDRLVFWVVIICAFHIFIVFVGIRVNLSKLKVSAN